jgi:YrbI family 3-deoxy-D-manno-octulosonate 8-phosphate phosphatase
MKTGGVLAIVPARGGSKSIPHKNIIELGGHPLIAYSIAAGQQARQVDRVIVSTDDPSIAEVARQYGAEVPFLRPTELALDVTPDLPVFEHALNWLENHEGYRPEIVVQLRPTSPLRPPGCVDGAIDLLRRCAGADSVRGVILSGQNPYKMWRIAADGHMEPLLCDVAGEAYNMPRQNLPATYWQTGHIDVIRSSAIADQGSMTGKTVFPYILDSAYGIDIDQPRDVQRAEYLLRQAKLEIVRPGKTPRPLPAKVDLVVLDFDGVMTDNRVWTDSDGREMVAAHRGDGWGLARIKQAGIKVLVLSTETNPVVEARCRKLGVPVIQGAADKAAALREIFDQGVFSPAQTIFLGNDVNDVPCFSLVACALVVSDAHPEARVQADIILELPGGHGAVRALCDRLVSKSGGPEE